MVGSSDEREFLKGMERIESLLHEVEHFRDPKAQAHTREIVQSILDLHGAGLQRVFERIAETGESGLALIDALAQDDLVGSLLLLYGLHPLDLETRVRQALDKVRPRLRAHGGNVELLGIVGGVVRLRIQGDEDGCASSAQTLRLSIEEAITEKAPDVMEIEVETLTNGQPVAVGRTRIALPIRHG